MKLNPNIKIVSDKRETHSKASEEYVSVRFDYPQKTWEGWIPVEYRRTGVSIKTEDELVEYLNNVYAEMNPDNYSAWLESQKEFWAGKKAEITKSFFDCLLEGSWQCADCTLPKNPNFARRIQDLKEFGYTLATNKNKFCTSCNANKTHIMLLPIKRQGVGKSGYEVFSPKLRRRIISVLGGVDAYENKVNAHCLPDHKFSEIRWDDETKENNPDNMTDMEIKNKFQLLTNQRNQQKREVCRTCYQTGVRGTIFGIDFYYEGTKYWDKSIPAKGKSAEKGCEGCPWYDIARWRSELQRRIHQPL
ncbi:MAG: restriction endonuclease [Defluviitaleaceae bacterium]|nr:restriction endonuclease [Defluviitaleaceae bacterium]MCL2263857.1 restriction endonuclease [Defluviitaleaceae bacterium]